MSRQWSPRPTKLASTAISGSRLKPRRARTGMLTRGGSRCNRSDRQPIGDLLCGQCGRRRAAATSIGSRSAGPVGLLLGPVDEGAAGEDAVADAVQPRVAAGPQLGEVA